MSALESGKGLAEQILAKLPESLRGQVKSVFDAPEAVDAITLLGDSALARSDYSKQMDDIRKKTGELETLQTQVKSDYDNLTAWFTENKEKLTQFDTIKPEYDRLKAAPPSPNPNPNPNPAPVAGMTKEDFDKALAARDSGYAAVLGLTSTLSVKHFRDFNEVLDVSALIEHATKNRVPLFDPKADVDAYRAVHGEKLTAKATADEKARVDKLVNERLAEERKNQQQPYPIAGGTEPSALDTLNQPDRTTRYTADAAAAKYEELVAASGAGR